MAKKVTDPVEPETAATQAEETVAEVQAETAEAVVAEATEVVAEEAAPLVVKGANGGLATQTAEEIVAARRESKS